MEIIKLKNLFFKYNLESKSDFKLEIDKFNLITGNFISILGPNGSGKSTLIKILSGIIEPVKGEILFRDKPYSKMTRKDLSKELAYVPQNFSTNFSFSLYEIVMMGRSPYLNFFGVEAKQDKELVLKTLEQMEILHLRDKGINEVSGGEAQRAFIARAMVQQPKILLLDEPNTHLDIKHQISIFKILHELNIINNLIIVIITHDINLAMRFSNRVLLMNKGSIIYDDKPDKILTEKNIMEIFDTKAKIITDSTDSRHIVFT
ncbi:MAG: ABC transporter [Ignavibacteriae bacterium]|nr:MAG: ABC transporter [Ignavibacteriota bacterium]